jgi:hypothetical protein
VGEDKHNGQVVRAIKEMQASALEIRCVSNKTSMNFR